MTPNRGEAEHGGLPHPHLGSLGHEKMRDQRLGLYGLWGHVCEDRQMGGWEGDRWWTQRCGMDGGCVAKWGEGKWMG